MNIICKSAIATVLIGLASCSAQKKVPYIQNAETIPQEILSTIPQPSDAVLATGDLLNISITSPDMTAIVPFIKGMYVDEKGQITRISTNSMSSSNNEYEKSTDYYLIGQDGEITFPIIGSIKAAGLTKSELAAQITSAIYPKYVKECPAVDVRLMNFRVSVTGAVKSPGVYQSKNERMNFFEAIAMAGDLDIKGDRENILLYRTNPDGTREVHKLDIHDKNFLLSPYFTLQQNDIIYVSPNSSMASNAWQLNPGVTATFTFIGGIASLASLVIGIVNLTKD